MIMSNQISRDEALKELDKNPYPHQNLLLEDLEFFLKKFDFTEQEFNEIMKESPREPTDFKSYEGMFEKLKPLLLKIKEYAKGN